MKDEIAQTEARYREKSRMLDDAREELRASNSFLTQRDTISGMEVIRMVENLNHEIFQFAACVAESWPSDPEENLDHSSTWESLGEGLDEASTSDSELGPTEIQAVALQIGVVELCGSLIGSWSSNPEVDNTLRSIYRDLAERGKHRNSLEMRD